MKLDKTLLKDEQYKNAQGYRSRLALLDYAEKKLNLWEWTAQHYDFSQTKVVLEVGCGTGDFWTHLQSQNNSFEKIYMTDFSEGMLNTARETLINSPLLSKINFEVADVEQLPYPDQKFDTVLAHLMLYHPKSQQKALNEITRVLKKDGWIGITTFNVISQQREMFEVAHKIDARFPGYAVTIEPFDEKVADEWLPKYFSHIQKYTDEVIVKIPNSKPLVDAIRTHPVTQTLGLKEDFLKKYQEEVEKIIAHEPPFQTRFTPVIYICKKPNQI